ncbi:unnamed protein product [Symbiodinium sp. CCMP2592]|nr:unnamed protein product [Symbiodinium sp. CCMP2592]
MSAKDGDEGDGSGSESLPEKPHEINYVFHGGIVQHEYEVGVLSVGDRDAPKTVSVILISAFEGNRVVAALPRKAWDRKDSNRRFPSGPFAKPTMIEVAAATFEDREQPAGINLKVWIGLLSRDVADAAVFGGQADKSDVTFQDSSSQFILPLAAGLVQAADGQFSFVTAPSAPDHLEARLSALEASIAKLTDFVTGAAPSQKPQGVAAPRAKNAAGPSRQKTAKPGSVPGTPVHHGAARDLPGFDPAVVRAARESGIGQHELQELEGLLTSKRPALGDYTAAPTAAQPLGPPSELDARSQASLGIGQLDDLELGANGTPIESGVVALTRIVADLSKQKRAASDRRGGLEAVLDRAEGSSLAALEAGGSSSGRLLQNALKNEPEAIYTTIERLLTEYLLHRREGTDLAGSYASSRAWLEHRSNLGGYGTTVRLTWILCGVWDALRNENVAEARARAALGVACADQQSLDNGSWVLADQFSLERLPPMASFASRGQNLDFTGSGPGRSFLFAPVSSLAAPLARGWSRISEAVFAWNSYGPVTAEAMGRTAGKVGGAAPQLDSVPNLNLAKEVDVSRLSLPPEPPAFDPSSLLDRPMRELFLSPSRFSVPLEEAASPPPRVKSRAANKQARLDFLSALDQAGRLRLFDAEAHDPRTACGLFALPKSIQADLQHLSAFKPHMWQWRHVSVALGTMAMGDTNSVSIGQAAHVGLALQYLGVDFEHVLSIRGRVPRGPFMLESSAWENDRRRFLSEPVGLERPCWARLIPLVALTLAVMTSPFVSEVLEGSWVAVFSFKRRAMCLLEEVHRAQRDRARSDLLALSVPLRAEFFRWAPSHLLCAPTCLRRLLASWSLRMLRTISGLWSLQLLHLLFAASCRDMFRSRGIGRDCWLRWTLSLGETVCCLPLQNCQGKATPLTRYGLTLLGESEDAVCTAFSEHFWSVWGSNFYASQWLPRSIAKAVVRSGCAWALTFDWAHDHCCPVLLDFRLLQIRPAMEEEAANPGPSRKRRPRTGSLFDIELVEANRWEELEPVSHRVGLALALRWRRWAAVTLATFYCVARPGELIGAKRSQVLTPIDLMDEATLGQAAGAVGDPEDFAVVMSFQLQPAHFPKEYAAAIVETQEMKQDIQVAEQENKTKVIRKQTELFSARQLAHQIVIKAEGDAQQTLVSNQADVAQFKYRQQVLAEGYARALQFFSASGQDAVPEFLSYMKLEAFWALIGSHLRCRCASFLAEAFKAHDNSKKTVKLTPVGSGRAIVEVASVTQGVLERVNRLRWPLGKVLVGTFVPKLRTWLEAIVKAANFLDQDAMSVDLQDLLRARHHAILTRRSTQHVGVMLCKLEQDSRKLASLGVVFNFEELQIHDDDQNELESFQDVFQQFIGLHPGLPLEPPPGEEEEDPAVTMNLLEGLSDQAPTEIRRHKLLRWQSALRRLGTGGLASGPLVPEQPSLEVLELATTLLLPQLLHSKALSFSAGSDSARSCPAFDMSDQAFGHMAPMPNVALGELEVLLCDILAELCDLYPKHICPLLWRLFREYLKDPGHWHSCLLVLALLTRLSCSPRPLPYRSEGGGGGGDSLTDRNSSAFTRVILELPRKSRMWMYSRVLHLYVMKQAHQGMSRSKATMLEKPCVPVSPWAL